MGSMRPASVLRCGIILSLSLLGVVACGDAASRAPVGQASSRSLSRLVPALPLPPDAPCTYPTSSDVANQADASDTVIDATVGPGTYSDSTEWTFPLDNVSVLLSRSGTPAPTNVSEDGVPSQALLHPGEYILFLTEDPDQSFYVTDGMLGAFWVDAAGWVNMNCPNYQDPPNPLVAQGTLLSKAQFMSDIPSSMAPRPLPSEQKH